MICKCTTLTISACVFHSDPLPCGCCYLATMLMNGAGCKVPSIVYVLCQAQSYCINNTSRWSHELTGMSLWDRGNAGLVSTKADMYSFGVVLWELVTADYPRFGQQWYRAPRSAAFLDYFIALCLWQILAGNAGAFSSPARHVHLDIPNLPFCLDIAELHFSCSPTLCMPKCISDTSEHASAQDG